MTANSILFLSHDATRTGAPIWLLHFLRWFKKNSNRPFSVLVGHGGRFFSEFGVLLDDFEGLAETWSVDRSAWYPGRLRTVLLTKAGLPEWMRRAGTLDVRRFAARCSPALIYANSIASAPTIEMLEPQVPILTHVHEMEFTFGTQSKPALSRLLKTTSQFVACSNVVGENLVRNHAVSAARIETIYESIPFVNIKAERTRQQVFDELKIPRHASLVVGSGTVGWRKGTDLFAQLARTVCRERPIVYFTWVGGGSASEVAQFEHDLRLAGLLERVRLTGVTPKPADYFAAADVFVLTSREDPYPLVCLEAAALQKPIVCFLNAGGMPEFVEENCGFAVPYLDVMAMANRLAMLLDSSQQRLIMGTAAQRKVMQRHDINVAGPRIAELIEKTIARRTEKTFRPRSLGSVGLTDLPNPRFTLTGKA